MRTKPPRTRNDSLILESATDVIGRVGVGGATLNAVARQAGLSHTAMTQRFQNSGELLGSVWEHRVLSDFLLPLVALARSVIESDEFGMSRLREEIGRVVFSNEYLSLATEMFCAFPCNMSLRPLVQESFLEVSAFGEMESREALVQQAYIIELLLGAAIVSRTLPAQHDLLVARLARMLTDAREAHAEEPVPETDASHLISYPFDTGSEKLDRVLASCLWHVAEVGFDGMSTKKIAQRAGVSEGYIFSVFKTKAEIFLHATELQEQMGLEANRIYAQGTGAAFDEYMSNAIFLRDWQKPELSRQRAIMLEQRRAAWHNDEMKQNSAKALENLISSLAGDRDVLTDEGRVTLLLNLALPIGAAVMAEMYPAISGYSHTVVTPSLNLEG